MAARRDLGLGAVAREAGVSTATVSNTLNRPHMVAPATRERVMAAIEALDFVPNRAAATLRQGFNRLLGLVVPDVANPFYAAIVDAVAAAADEHGYAVALCVSHDDHAREMRLFDTLAEQRAAGAIVVPLTADSSRLSQLRMVGARLILVDRTADPHDSCSVAIDDVLGGTLAVSHLLDSGRPRVTLVNGATSIPQCADRREGALAALADAGLPASALVEFEVPEMTVDAGAEIGRRIAAGDAPRQIFCTNDQLAVGVIHGLASAGLDVPRDARVVGYGDLGIESGGSVGLSTIGQPKREMGIAAVSKLLDELREGAGHHHTSTIFEPRLIARDTTALVG